MSYKTINRRTVLRGAFGTTIALPWLEAMNTNQAQAATAPLRYGTAFMGISLGGDGDNEPNRLVPTSTGANYDLRQAAKPLGDAGVQKDVTIVSGLEIPTSGPAGYKGFHAGTMSALLTGVANGDKSVVLGTSTDEIVADAWKNQQRRFRSLRLRVQLKGYAAGPYKVRDSISYRREAGQGESLKLGMQASPQAAYRDLFSGFEVPDDAEERARREFERAKRKTVLDFVLESSRSLQGRLGGADKIRLERHLEHVRLIEARLAEVPTVAQGGCRPTDPGPDPAEGQDVNKDDGRPIITENNGYSGEEERALAMTEILAMALACDLTRVFAFQYTMAQSFLNSYHLPETRGIKSDMHQISHFGAGRPTTEKVSRCVAWHVRHFANLVKRLKEIPEGDGSVLDSCAFVLMPEGGHGGTGGGAHSGERMACLVAGGAQGKLRRGHHIVAANQHPARVLISLMNAVGVNTGNKLGNVTGSIDGLALG